MYKDAIIIKGARVHNLKNVNVEVPLGKIVAVAGVSGSGKSSLALGVIYSEGSRRYLEALSTYTRRRIAQSEKPNVDSIEYVPAALALHQRPNVPNIRSTFGTATELLNCLRLLYSRCGNYRCPNGHVLEPSMNVARELELECPVCREKFYGLGAEEYSYNSDGACRNCSGTGIVRTVDDAKLVPDENKTLEEGAVESWNMFGISWMYRVAGELGVRVTVPFKDLTDKEKDIVYKGEEVQKYIAIPSKNGKMFDLNCKYRNAHQAVVEALKGTSTEKGLDRINKYLTVGVCPECNGTRLNKRANSTLLAGKNLSDACKMTLEELVRWLPHVVKNMPPEMRDMAESITAEFMDNATALLDLGLRYISLDRNSNTLSTGELQRVQLARTVRNRTTGVLYVLDEPSIGLHPSNVDGLIKVMKRLVEDGNSILLVDHDTRILKAADYMIEMGLKAGNEGGNIIAEGTIKEIEENANSLIGPFLSGKENILVRKKTGKDVLFSNGSIEISTGRIHTVKPMNVKIPKGRLTVITGVSGSGKTTLILEALYPAVKAKINNEKLPACVKNVHAENIKKIDLIDSVPIGNNVRSTLATYSGVLDDLRKAYSGLPLSKERKYKAADFSYNTGNLRCKTCDGTGAISLDVQFLSDVEIICPECNGRRYAKDAGIIKYNGLSVSDVMALTVDEALEKLSGLKTVKDKLQILSDLGLGYLTIGEATPSLSGGEAQRLKLASEIGKTQESSLYIFDEPSIGLHPLDVRVLLHVFQRLIDNGATVVVIEHDLDIIANADYIVDIGLDNENSGGDILAAGTLEDIIHSPKSITGTYLDNV